MVTDQQYWRLMKLQRTERALAGAAARAGMDEKTARKYRLSDFGLRISDCGMNGAKSNART